MTVETNGFVFLAKFANALTGRLPFNPVTRTGMRACCLGLSCAAISLSSQATVQGQQGYSNPPLNPNQPTRYPLNDNSPILPPPYLGPKAPRDTQPFETSSASSSTSQSFGSPVVDSEAEFFEASKFLAQVGDEVILLGDIQGQINQVIESAMKGASESDKKQQRELLIRQLLPKIIDQKMLYVDIVRGLPKEADVDEIKQKIGEQFEVSGLPPLLQQENVETARELDVILRKYGTSVRQAKEAWIENQFVGYFVRDKIPTPDVTRDDLYDYFREHHDDYEIAARAKWEQIVVRFDKFPNKAAAQAAIAQIGNEIVYGAPFDAVAKRSSQGFNADTGGKFDWTNHGSLADEAIDEAVFSLRLHYLSDIIETRSGFVILRVTDREEEHYEKFEDVQGDIKTAILNIKRGKAVEKYVTGLKTSIPHRTIYDKPERESAQSESTQTASPNSNFGRSSSFR